MRIRKAETGPPATQFVHQDNYGGLHVLLIWPSGRTISAYLDPVAVQEWNSLFTQTDTD